MSKYKNLLLIVLAFLAGGIVMLTTTIALAHGGDASKIHGCVRNNGLLNGFIRIVGASTNCAGNETALDWNIQGVPGPSGPPGASGSAEFICVRCIKSDVASRLGTSNLTNKNFHRANLSFALLSNENFTGSSFTEAVLSSLTAHNSNFTNTNLANTNLRESNIYNANFTGVNLSGANLTGGDFQSGNFTNATLTDTIVDDGSSSTTSFFNVDFTGANLDGATGMNNATITGVTWSNTICPDGTNSNSHSNTCVGHLTP